jgi:hypothetical protein
MGMEGEQESSEILFRGVFGGRRTPSLRLEPVRRPTERDAQKAVWACFTHGERGATLNLRPDPSPGAPFLWVTVQPTEQDAERLVIRASEEEWRQHPHQSLIDLGLELSGGASRGNGFGWHHVAEARDHQMSLRVAPDGGHLCIVPHEGGVMFDYTTAEELALDPAATMTRVLKRLHSGHGLWAHERLLPR